MKRPHCKSIYIVYRLSELQFLIKSSQASLDPMRGTLAILHIVKLASFSQRWPIPRAADTLAYHRSSVSLHLSVSKLAKDSKHEEFMTCMNKISIVIEDFCRDLNKDSGVLSYLYIFAKN